MKHYCTSCGQPAESKSDNLLECANGHQTWVNPIPGSTVCVIKDGRVLFVRRGVEPMKGALDLAGGFIELNETGEGAAVREIKEELGIEVEVAGYVGSYADKYPDGRATLNLLYAAEYTSGTITLADDLAGGEVVWRDLTDLPERDEVAWDWYPEALEDLSTWWQARGA